MSVVASNTPKRVLLAAPRGYCAGVDRAVQTVEHALDLHGPPVYVRKSAAQDYTVVLIGHEGHEEVEGTTGEAPDSIVLVQTADDVDALEVSDPGKIAYITQTTLSVDETTEIIARLRERFPEIVGPKSDDICYATTNRQIAVKQLARECDLVLVIGSTNSSNSNRLVEGARGQGPASSP